MTWLKRREPVIKKINSAFTCTSLSPESEARYAHITEAFGYGRLELLYKRLEELVQKLDKSDT